jgi:hypothetical protein
MAGFRGCGKGLIAFPNHHSNKYHNRSEYRISQNQPEKQGGRGDPKIIPTAWPHVPGRNGQGSVYCSTNEAGMKTLSL